MPEKTEKTSIGGKRAGSGRKKGVRNRVSRELGAFARTLTLDAMAVLYDLMWNSENDAVKKACATEILDRGHGRAPQYVHFDPRKLPEMSDDELAALYGQLTGEQP